jgi:hypothetical protein
MMCVIGLSDTSAIAWPIFAEYPGGASMTTTSYTIIQSAQGLLIT